MRIFKWTASLSLACALAATAAYAQTSNTGNNPGQPQDPPANGATRVESPIQNSTVRTWQDSTRSRSQTTGSDSTSGSRTARPANGRNGAANTQVTFPSCQDTAAANFGSFGNCIYIPTNPGPVSCSGSDQQTRTVSRTCSSGGSSYTETQIRYRTCNSGTWSAYGPYQFLSDDSATRCVISDPVCNDPAASNYRQIGSCTYPTCTGPSSEPRNSSVACPSPTMGTYTVTHQWNRTCSNGSWSAFTQGAQISSTQSTDCITPPTTCQDPTASNFGGALPCVYAPRVCDVRPGTADCCNSEPGHASCREFTCTQNGGRWDVAGNRCNMGFCGMGPDWPCGPAAIARGCYPGTSGGPRGGYICACPGNNNLNTPGMQCP